MPSNDYRVIEILDEYSILINYGMKHGASEGDEIRVLSTGPEIIDPVTEETLGTLDFIKSTLTIATAYNKFSLCKDIESKPINALVSPFSQFQTTSKTIKPLDIDKGSMSNKKMPSDTTIKIGDKVEII